MKVMTFNIQHCLDYKNQKIDYILYRGLKCKNTKVINEVVSDHLPIITEVIL